MKTTDLFILNQNYSKKIWNTGISVVTLLTQTQKRIDMKKLIAILIGAVTFFSAQAQNENEEDYNLFYGEDIWNFVSYDFVTKKDAYWIGVVRVDKVNNKKILYAVRDGGENHVPVNFFCRGEFYAVAIDKDYNQVTTPWYFTIDDESPKFDDQGTITIELE